jgi:RNA polymerase sigma-70 factor (ECF subfamily)
MPVTDTAIYSDDMQLVERLRRGDESAFMLLVEMYQKAMVRMALVYVHMREIAEEVVQETWISVLKGLDKFEGRSSLKTWIFSILVNRAKTRAQREGRTLPFSALDNFEVDADESAVDSDRFNQAGHWIRFPDSWDDVPEERLLSQEIASIITQAIEQLPPNQRQVITLRDINGWDSAEVRNVLNISETNQRVLLHRARATVRRALERYLDRKEN